MPATKKRENRFRVGDWVSFPYGSGNLIAQVIEARGPLGVNRRRIYRVSVPRGADEPDSFEMPEDDLSPAAPPEKSAMIDYLQRGGLVEILRSNLNGGKGPPNVWLTFTPRGQITHTFDAQRGLAGGAPVPFFALHEDKVFTPKKDEVIGLVTSFGLSSREAEKVIATVGTSP